MDIKEIKYELDSLKGDIKNLSDGLEDYLVELGTIKDGVQYIIDNIEEEDN